MCVPLPLQASSVRSHHRGVRSAIVREATALSAGVVMDDQMKVAWGGGGGGGVLLQLVPLCTYTHVKTNILEHR